MFVVQANDDFVKLSYMFDLFQLQDGRTALALATWNGHFGVVKELVAKGANPNIQDPVCLMLYTLYTCVSIG